MREIPVTVCIKNTIEKRMVFERNRCKSFVENVGIADRIPNKSFKSSRVAKNLKN